MSSPDFFDLLRVHPGEAPDLGAIDPGSTPGFDGGKKDAQARVHELHDVLADFQERLWAESKASVLVVLQGVDAAGKDGLIRKVISAFNPQGTHVTGFGVPTEEELRHDYLWRIHAATPGKGRVGVFNRSHYEDVLVVRVNELVPRDVWERRYDQINTFEAHLAANGTRILKFYLHVSRDEQRRRLEKRLRNPTKHWKWSSGDLEVRERWDDYLDAYTDALARCSTEAAPWFVIPADRKWYRNLAVAEILARTAAEMNPQWPAADDGMEETEIPA
jgi:PPK2 family polyphosphate:nucleotide phosphotransferase